MKKYLLLLLFCTTAWASNSTFVEAKFSYFYFSSEELRKVYDQGGINYEVATCIPVWRGFHLWGAVDYFYKEGRSLEGDEKTNIRIIPLTLGLKYIYHTNKFGFYGGVGPRYFFVRTKNDSDFVDSKTSVSGLGGVAEAGVLYSLSKHWLLDLFGSYSFKRLHPHTSHSTVQTHAEQVGGWNIGGGLGYKF